MAASTISAPKGELPVYVATPDGPGPWPGVVVIHDALGMTQDLRNQADWLASEGHLAVAPDLFAGRGKLTCMVSVMRETRAAGEGRSMTSRLRGRGWRGGTTARRGRGDRVLHGRGLALLLAPDRGFAASSVNYGAAPKSAYTADFLRRACPIVGSYGGTDRTLRGAAGRLDRVLTAVGVEHDVKEYPGAGHGFLNDHEGAGDKLPAVIAIMARFSGMGYNEAATQDARRRIAAFFDAHL